MDKIKFIKEDYLEYFKNNSYDKTHLILKEINSNWENKDYSSLICNIRTILNIIPTILGYSAGNTVAIYSSAPMVSKSEKEIISNLNSITRKWGDGVNHDITTVGFEQVGLISPAINILLAVVIKLSGDSIVMKEIEESLKSSEKQNTFKAIKDFFLSVDKNNFEEIFKQKITKFSYNLTERQIVILQEIANTPLAKQILSFESNGNFIWNDQNGPKNGFNFRLDYLD